MIQVYATNIGNITNTTQNGLLETIQITALRPDYPNNIELELYANTSLGLDTVCDIVFFDFEWPSPCSEIDSTFIPFKLVGCNLGPRIFKFFNPTELSITTNDNFYDCEVLSEEEGYFNLSIYNLIGDNIRQINWFKENKIFEKKNIILDNSDLSSGSYFILLQSPNDFIRKQILKVK
jgi:hypothetical protein